MFNRSSEIDIMNPIGSESLLCSDYITRLRKLQSKNCKIDIDVKSLKNEFENFKRLYKDYEDSNFDTLETLKNLKYKLRKTNVKFDVFKNENENFRKKLKGALQERYEIPDNEIKKMIEKSKQRKKKMNMNVFVPSNVGSNYVKNDDEIFFLTNSMFN